MLASSQIMIPVLDDFHFRVLAFLQGQYTCFYLNLALPTQKIQINIRTMGELSTLFFQVLLTVQDGVRWLLLADDGQ